MFPGGNEKSQITYGRMPRVNSSQSPKSMEA